MSKSVARVEIKNLQQTVGLGASLLLFMTPSVGVPIPSKIHHLPKNATSTRLLSSDESLTLSGIHFIDLNRAVTLRDFALSLLANTKELDENVATALNANFWDLYEPI